jgi:hypothetical protein
VFMLFKNVYYSDTKFFITLITSFSSRHTLPELSLLNQARL